MKTLRFNNIEIEFDFEDVQMLRLIAKLHLGQFQEYGDVDPELLIKEPTFKTLYEINKVNDLLITERNVREILKFWEKLGCIEAITRKKVKHFRLKKFGFETLKNLGG